MAEILPIVEGHGDAAAIPVLIRRIAEAHAHYPTIHPPQRRGELPVVRKNFESDLRVAMKSRAAILWVMDYDCDTCNDVSRDLTDLRRRAAAIAPQQRIEFTFMVKEYESLFLADWETTRRVFPDIADGVILPADIEAKRGVKEWLSSARPKGLTYRETVDQARLTARLDLPRLRERSPSFLRFEQSVLNLLS